MDRLILTRGSNMVDVFEIAPQDATARRAPLTSFAYAGQEARIVRYQHLLSKLGSGGRDDCVQVDWLPPQEDDSIDCGEIVKRESDEPLVGTFADAAAAMA
jgi:hypothetical protein